MCLRIVGDEGQVCFIPHHTYRPNMFSSTSSIMDKGWNRLGRDDYLYKLRISKCLLYVALELDDDVRVFDNAFIFEEQAV